MPRPLCNVLKPLWDKLSIYEQTVVNSKILPINNMKDRETVVYNIIAGVSGLLYNPGTGVLNKVQPTKMIQEMETDTTIEQFEDDPGEDYLVQRVKDSDAFLGKLDREFAESQLYKTGQDKAREFKHQKDGQDYWNQYWREVYNQLKTSIPDNIKWRVRVFRRLQYRNHSDNTSKHRYYNQELDCWFDHSALNKPMICGYKSYIPSNFKHLQTCTKLPHHDKMDKLYDRAHGEWQNLK